MKQISIFALALIFLAGCGSETEPVESTTPKGGKDDRPLQCIDCGEGATCELITYESRTRVVCQPDGADTLTCAQSYACEHEKWEEWRDCTDACDSEEDVVGCQSDCTDVRLVNEAFCRNRNAEIESIYLGYDDCRFEFCFGFWSEFDGLPWEIECMEEHCSESTSACLQN